ncbi:MAG: SigB/SigF/SigG family RNA polymerase sigma factor [Armatimonadota bacterium]
MTTATHTAFSANAGRHAARRVSGPVREEIPDLTPGELEALLAQYRRTRDVALRNRLVLQYRRLVWHLAGRFAGGPAAGREDLVQVGFMGLIVALERYEPERSGSFEKFATPTILGVIKHYLRDHTWSLKAPRRLRELSTSLRGIRDRLEQQLGRSPTIAEMAEAAGATEEQILEAMEVDRHYYSASADALRAGGMGEALRSCYEALGEEDPQLDDVERREAVRGMLSTLEERERTILYQRFYEEKSQLQVAQGLGISQMHVSRLERRALQRLKLLVG